MILLDAIIINSLTKKYKDVCAVDKLSLTVRQGELFALLGVNGAGKTTTIKMLSGLTAPSSGDALINGKSIVHDLSEVKRMIAVAPQEMAIAGGLTVKENLELMYGVCELDQHRRDQKISELALLLGLDTVLKKRAGKLSGGWQRRLSIAMALITEPQVLFLDEPTLGLDVMAKHELRNIIRSLKGKTTIVLTTHALEEAETLSDRIAIMKDGRLLVCASPSEIKEMTHTDHFEDAFISIVKEAEK